MTLWSRQLVVSLIVACAMYPGHLLPHLIAAPNRSAHLKR
jgi:hypothetical protein